MREYHGLPMEPGVSKCLLFDSPADPRFMQHMFQFNCNGTEALKPAWAESSLNDFKCQMDFEIATCNISASVAQKFLVHP